MSSTALPHPQAGREHQTGLPLVGAQLRSARITDLDILLRAAVVIPGVAALQEQAPIPQPGIYMALRFCSTLYGVFALLCGLIYDIWSCVR